MKDNTHFTKRIALMIISVIINGLGVAMVTVTALGTVPATSIPNVLGIAFSPTIGEFTFIMSVVQILLQIVILKKDFKLIQLLQIVPAVLISFFIDFFLKLLQSVPLDNHGAKMLMLIVGCVVLGYSIALEVYADIVYLPLDGFNMAVSIVTHKSFENIKIIVDCVMVAVAIFLSFALIGHLDGIREGTLIAAILAGLVVKFFSRNLFSKKFQ